MADEARAKRAALLEEKKKRLEALKARRADRANAEKTKKASPRGGGGEDLDQYIDGLLNSDAPAVPGTQQEETGPTPPQTPDQQPGKATPDPSPGDGTAEASAAAAAAAAVAAAAPALARNVETFTMSTQTEMDDFPAPLDDDDDDDSGGGDEDEVKEKADKENAASSSGGEGGEGAPPPPSSGEANAKGVQTMDPASVAETVLSRPFVAFLNSASKKVERALGAPALAELLDDPAYDDGIGYGGDEGGEGAEGKGEAAAGAPPSSGGVRTRRKGALTSLGAAAAAGGPGAGLVKSHRKYHCPRWTDGRDLTSVSWSPHRRDTIVASYQTSAGTRPAVDAAVRSVAPPQGPSSSLLPQSAELRSDGLALVWNLALPDRPEHIFCCGSPVLQAAAHPSEPCLVVGGCHSGQVVVWDVRAGRLPVQRSAGPALGGHAHPVRSLDVGAEGGSALLTADSSGRLNLWSWANLREPADAVLTGMNVSAAAVAPESGAILLGDEAGKMHAVLPSESGAASASARKRSVRSLDGEDGAAADGGHFGMVTGLSTKAAPPAGGHLSRGFLRGPSGLVLSCGVDWTVKLWAPAYGDRPLLSFVSHSYDYMSDVAWSTTHPSLFATASGDGTLGFWNLAHSLDEPLSGSAGISVGELSSEEGGGSGGSGGVVNQIRWSADGRSLAVAQADRLHVVSLANEVARPKGDEEARMMGLLRSRGFLEEE